MSLNAVHEWAIAWEYFKIEPVHNLINLETKPRNANAKTPNA
jgi:hypothetical protein